MRYHHSSMTKITCCTLILKVFIFLVEILLKTLCLKKFFDLLFFSFYRERSVIADISLTFDEPVGGSEVESLLLDAINDGGFGILKVDTLPVGSTISGVYKLSTTVIWSAPNESWVCDLGICTKNGLSLWWTSQLVCQTSSWCSCTVGVHRKVHTHSVLIRRCSRKGR